MKRVAVLVLGAALSATSAQAAELSAEDIVATRSSVWLSELLQELVDETVASIFELSPALVSPMAIRSITLGSNVQPTMKTRLASMFVVGLRAGAEVSLVDCLECRATQGRVEGDRWVLTRGIVRHEEQKQVAERLGVKSFLDIAFGFDRDRGIVELDVQIIRAEDSAIVWAESFRADGNTPLIHRGSDSPKRRAARLEELQRVLEGRPSFGYSVGLGFGLLPYDDADRGDIAGVTLAWRIFERFGGDGRAMFGFDLMGFLSPERLAGGMLTAGAWWLPLRPDLVDPEIRLGAKAGALLVGNQGNAACFQLGAEVLLRYRFGVYGYAVFLTTSEFDGKDLGGVGGTGGVSFNW